MLFGLAFAVSFGLSVLLTHIFRRMALRYGVIDYPGGRHRHVNPTPYLGGVAIYLSFVIALLLFLPMDKHLWGLVLGATIVVLAGVWDDKKGLSPLVKLFWQAIGASVLVLAGVGIVNITNPFGGIIDLSTFNYRFDFFGVHHLTVLADIFTLIWVMALINVMNFLDGVDGLAGSVSFIGAIILFSLSLRPDVLQPDLAMISVILAGVLLGFLNFNFPPAKIFLGDAGSMFLGFILASLAILSSGKIATTALVLGVPILDLLWVTGKRIFILRKAPWVGDRNHIHHRLLDMGLRPWMVVIIISLASAAFGITALFLDGKEKLWAMIILSLVVYLGMIVAEKRFGR